MIQTQGDRREGDTRPVSWRGFMLAATIAVAIVSAVALPPPEAAASALLGALMVVGAVTDARFMLLPDLVTLGATAAALAAAPLLSPDDPIGAASGAAIRAAVLAGAFELLRRSFATLRGHEGLGRGDVKLAAAIGAWLPLDLIPICIGLAAAAALTSVALAERRGHAVARDTKLPFGAFLCPALWLAYFVSALIA